MGLADFLRAPRYEVLPTGDALDLVVAHVPKDITVTVTASPSRGMPATIHLAVALARRGYRAVPHLSARMIRDPLELGQILDALQAAEIGVTGYPESHPFIHDDLTIQAMWDKRRLATYIVSNMSFDPETVKRWVERVRRRGVELPIHIGMAGVADPARLLRLSTRIGVAESARFLRGHPSWLARMFRPGGYEPGRFVNALMAEIGLPERRVAGLHIFTFNEIEPTERWRREMLARVT